MLVLSRQRNEKIVIGKPGEEIVITIVDIRDNFKVRVGIDAPKEVPVNRFEVYEAIQRQQGGGNV